MFANDNLPLTDVVGVGTACPVGPHFYEFVSDSENRRRHWIGLVLAALLVHFAGCGDRTSSAKVILAPEDNTFVSYWQCAEGLANGLKQVESHEQFLQQPRGIVNDPKENAESIKDILDQLCEDLEGYQEKLAQLPADKVKRLMNDHGTLIKRVRAVVDAVAQRHEKSPEILGRDWPRYQAALRADSKTAD